MKRWLLLAGVALAIGGGMIALFMSTRGGLASRPVASVPALLSAPAGLPEPLVLAPDGLADVRFGTDPASTVDALTEMLGPPAEDSMQPCDSESDLVRHVRWSTVTAAFPDDRFSGWIAGIYVPPDSPSLAAVTLEGVPLDAPVAELLDTYGERLTWTAPEESGFGEPVEGFGLDGYSPDAPTPTGIGGYVEGGRSDGRVITFFAGQPCGPP